MPFSLKATLRRLVEKTSLRHRCNDSWLYNQVYLKAAHPQYYQAKQQELQLHRQLLLAGGHSLIFDIGANQGNKAFLFSQLAHRVVCVEPDPAAANVLTTRFQHRPQITIVQAGVGDTLGTLPFHVLEPGSCLNTFSAKWAEQHETSAGPDGKGEVIQVPVVTLDKLITTHGRPDYIKIDAEGFEVKILEGLSQRIPLLSFECNLPQFISESIACVQRIAVLDPDCRFNFSTKDFVTSLDQPTWLTAQEMLAALDSERYSFLEVFARMTPSTA